MRECIPKPNLSMTELCSKRMNFSTQEVKKADSENVKGKTEEMKHSGALKLEDVLQQQVTSECLSIFNVNGTIRKAQKSKLQQTLTLTVIPEPEVYTRLSLTWASFGA